MTEEAEEAVAAALSESGAALTHEAADLLFHLLILLAERGIALDDVLAELERREGTSGLDEKAGRKPLTLPSSRRKLGSRAAKAGPSSWRFRLSPE